MDSPVDSVYGWDHGHNVSPTPNRHAHNFSSTSLFSVSTVSSHTFSNPTFSRGDSLKKSSKQRLIKLFKRSLKYTLKSNLSNTESHNLEYWTHFHKKLRRIIASFTDPLSLYDGLNDPFICKTSTKSCCSVIHILCKQLYLYSRSNRWSVAFKIWDSIQYLLDHGANTAIFYSKVDETPQKNYNALHTLYEGLYIMKEGDIITDDEFANYFSRAISAGNEAIHCGLLADFQEYQARSFSIASLSSIQSIDSNVSMASASSSSPELSSIESNLSSTSAPSFQPSVLTLCVYNDEDEWQNITYWMGDCVYNDYYVYLISPYLAKTFIMMGYDLLSLVLDKKDHLDFNKKAFTEAIMNDPNEIETVLQDVTVLEDKVIAFLWFIRYGNFKCDLIHIIDIGIKQLALNEFAVDCEIIEQILSFSHHFIVSNTVTDHHHMDKLDLLYWNEDQWMMTAFEVLFHLDNHWIDWIAQYVMPQLTKTQIQKIKKNLSDTTSEKEWNKFIRRISLQSIHSFCEHDIFGVIDTPKMQDIITRNYRNVELVPILMSASYDIQQTFGNSSILYQIMNDDTMDTMQLTAILNALHSRIDAMHFKSNRTPTAKLIINELLFSVGPWVNNQSIWRNITLAFDPKHKHFCRALNDWFHVLSTEQHHAKLIFFMAHDLIDFNYCLNADLIECALHSLMIEDAFNKKALCIQMIGDWIAQHVENEENIERKKETTEKAIVAITSNLSNIVPADRDTIIIGQYLDQLITGLSRILDDSLSN